jgi:proline dehydrogenase
MLKKKILLQKCWTRSLSSGSSVINFNDSKVCFQSKSATQLLRGLLVFQTCKIKPLVSHSEKLLKTSYKVFGSTITNSLLKATFFGHFCAGEDPETIRPTVKYLEQNGIGSILDYAAEADVEEKGESASTKADTKTKNQARVYDYKTEQDCDTHKATFEQCIKAVAKVSPTGFAAIKITALGNPELLKNASVALTELTRLFNLLDPHNTGYVAKSDFEKIFSAKVDGKDVSAYFDAADKNKDGKIDYIEWTNEFKIEELHKLCDHCTSKGPLYSAVLNEKERELFANMRNRIDSICTLAKSLGVRLMIDAEHSYFQPAIDNITVGLAKRYNGLDSFPVIFSTYQMYLKDSRGRLQLDMQRAQKGNYKFAAKLVRGAYMVLEREHALENKIPDPIHNTIEDTHQNYNGAVADVIESIALGNPAEIMIASHNQRSVELALAAMERHKLNPSAGVYFGQLLGMSDHLTFALGAKSYKAYKYVPYGKVNEVMPYLIRRAQENSGAFGGATFEINMIKKEMLRRLGFAQ